ncbi:hypothetical protein EZJ43_07785 [Pedobacter changchengzhani]|uniref:Uncharacterized protein n=1 Tax=Pedobacter changchengzhani TaxID=2529274 RepID=A0A4R5ML43_9SPHI|nr:hypothetical protein [Pedobacter changchengzhani]TDG36410.1 hypothetical protein EZJ43_07785 [Pedobacter changchengzhani]
MNIINDTGGVVGYGAFALGGFILIPIGAFATYYHNLLTAKNDGIKVGKKFYPSANYQFAIVKYDVPFKDRPLFSSFKKTKETFEVRRKGDQRIVFQEDLAMFSKNIKNLKEVIQNYNS